MAQHGYSKADIREERRSYVVKEEGSGVRLVSIQNYSLRCQLSSSPHQNPLYSSLSIQRFQYPSRTSLYRLDPRSLVD